MVLGIFTYHNRSSRGFLDNMCIRSPVGVEGVNAPTDVQLVQILVNAGFARYHIADHLLVDGVCGPATEAAIRRFQRYGVGLRRPNGRIAPGDQTLNTLHDTLPAQLSAEKLHAIMPAARDADICRFYRPLLAGLRAHGISSALRRAHFFAQIGEESCDLAVIELPLPENGDSADPSIRFRGRGLFKFVGRASYARYRAARGVDIVAEPERLATDATIAADAACWLWAAHGLNAHADANDLFTITDIIAGSRRQLPERVERMRRAKWVLAI